MIQVETNSASLTIWSSQQGDFLDVAGDDDRRCNVTNVDKRDLCFVSNAYAVGDNSYRTITNIYPHDGGITFNVDDAIITPSAPCGNRFALLLGSANYSAKALRSCRCMRRVDVSRSTMTPQRPRPAIYPYLLSFRSHDGPNERSIGAWVS